MAGLRLSRDTLGQFAAIARVRWQLFVNSLRTTRGTLELASRIFIGLIISVGAIGGAFGMGAGAWAFVSSGNAEWLSVLLWTVFMVWQLFPIMATAFTENTDSSTLLRFPLSYRSYFTVRLVFGALDPAAAMGGMWLLGILVGIGFAQPGLLLWTAVVLLAFAAVNVLLARMIFAWVERWLAQRRTREIMGVLFLLLMLSLQFIGPLMGRYSGRRNPEAMHVVEELSPVQRALPPGLTGEAIALMAQGRSAAAAGSAVLVCIYGIAILWLLDLRLKAEYHGENLNESKRPESAHSSVRALQLGWNVPGVSGPVAAVFEKEIRYLLRSGPMLFTLIMPVFMLLIFRLGPASTARGGSFLMRAPNLAFPSGAAYSLLILTNLVYNNFGGDSGGIQFFFASPVRIRQVVLGKNLAHMTVLTLIVALVWLGVNFIYAPPALDVTFATLAGILFAAPVNLAAGNLLSVYSPKRVDFAKFGRQRASQLTVLASLGIQFAVVALGASTLFLSRQYGSYWLGGLIFVLLAAIALAGYAVSLNLIDQLALKRQETLISELCRA